MANKKLVCIGYRPGRKSKMIKRTTLLCTSEKIDHPFPWNIYGDFREFLKNQEKGAK